jgi:serine/threonine protein kinase/Tol biopolymer transport system component
LLSAGSKVGPYEVTSAIGAGGMGEVYRAHDARLDRDVAIKLLPTSFSSNPDRLRRFAQEARAAAALNHPNILAIYDIGEWQGAPYIVSELLVGETLRDRLKKGALPARKTVEYALQITRGLAAAHDKGIVHRDLKPENTFLTQDDRVKILDFGLAKLTQSDQSDVAADAATAQVVTDAGTVMGTAGYMSPEQVRGKATDQRSDLFSFGSILYEMLSGKRAFQGDSPADTMSAILKEEPPELSETARNVPPALERIVRHCLEKSPAQRFQSASDVAFSLEALTEISTPSKSGAQAIATAEPKTTTRGLLLAVVSGLLAAALCLGFYLAGKRSSASSAPSFHRLTFRRGTIPAGRFSPDGQTIVYSAALEGKPEELFTTRFDSTDSRPLGLDKAGLLAISSKGELAVALEPHHETPFIEVGTLGTMPLAGGAPREVSEDVTWADWAPDSPDLAAVRFWQGGFHLEFPLGHVIYQPQGWISHVRFSPKGDLIAFADHVQTGDDGRMVITDRQGKLKRASSFFITVQGVAWSRDGKEVWFTASREGAARALYAMDLAGHERVVLRVPGTLTLQDITRDGRVLLGIDNAQFGIMGFRPGDQGERNLSWFDWSIASDITADSKSLLFFESGEGVGPNYSVFIRGMDGSPAVRLGSGSFPRLSPDGKWVAALNNASPEQLELLPVGAGQARQITHDALQHIGVGWVPNGKALVFEASEPNHPPHSLLLNLEDGKSRPITPEGTVGTLVSPDSKYLVAHAPDGKRWIYPLDGGDPQPLSAAITDSDSLVAWEADGKSLLVAQRGIPLQVWRVFLNSTRREPVRSFTPSDAGGIVAVAGPRFSADRKSYAYTYSRVLSDLYVVDGLK